MVISHKHKWIYLANPKSASSTLNLILKKQEGVLNCIDNSLGATNHMPYVECKQFLANQGLNIDDYFVFSFVRNPWDKVVSFYKWILRHQKEKTGHTEVLRLELLIDRHITSELNFYNFVTKLTDSLWANFGCEHMLFENGQNKLNFIGRVENLEEDFNILCNKIGILNSTPLYKANNTKYIKTNKHYTEYYNDETRSIVAERYAKDIEYFGYEFGK